jgi:hypothetical protein
MRCMHTNICWDVPPTGFPRWLPPPASPWPHCKHHSPAGDHHTQFSHGTTTVANRKPTPVGCQPTLHTCCRHGSLGATRGLLCCPTDRAPVLVQYKRPHVPSPASAAQQLLLLLLPPQPLWRCCCCTAASHQRLQLLCSCSPSAVSPAFNLLHSCCCCCSFCGCFSCRCCSRTAAAPQLLHSRCVSCCSAAAHPVLTACSAGALLELTASRGSWLCRAGGDGLCAHHCNRTGPCLGPTLV